MGLLYRSFFAIRDLSTNAGRPTNAVYGFIRKLREMRRTHAPTHWGVVFDGGMPEERLELLADYKAQRPSMPDELRGQLPAVDRYLDAAGIARLRIEGQEADDVMASVTAWAEPNAGEILLASSDKDLYQLVSDKASVLPLSGSAAPMAAAAVKEKTGVEPGQVVEWLAMVGDSVDNIPGVRGVGPKTAAKLLNEYRSLAGLRKHWHEVPDGKLKQSLEEAWGVVLRNVSLIRLRRDIDCGWDWPDLEARAPDVDRLLPLLDELEFAAMARELRAPELL